MSWRQGARSSERRGYTHQDRRQDDDVEGRSAWQGEMNWYGDANTQTLQGFDYAQGYADGWGRNTGYPHQTSNRWEASGQSWQASASSSFHPAYYRTPEYGNTYVPQSPWNRETAYSNDHESLWRPTSHEFNQHGPDSHLHHFHRSRPRFYAGTQTQAYADRGSSRQYSSMSSAAKRQRDETRDSNDARAFRRDDAPRTSVEPDGAQDRNGREASRASSPARLRIRTQPKIRYMRQTLQEPEQYPLDSDLPKPLPLLVLDLNGTLVYRTARTAERSKKPVLRPYLSNFLEYCLALHLEQEKQAERMTEWDEWDEAKKGAPGGSKESSPVNEESMPTAIGDAAADGAATKVELDEQKKPLHGSYFWSKQDEEPKARERATFRLLIWSSAQPHNVQSMARAFLHPLQAEQLLRVYARDTLVIDELYRFKSPSVKDLEIVWAALNNSDRSDPEALQKAEARLKAQERLVQDQARAGESAWSVTNDLEPLWEARLRKPSKSDESTTGSGYTDGFGYGPHNTLLLDDSLDKAHLQPHNHILLPEFDEDRARITKEYQESESKRNDDGSDSDSSDKKKFKAQMPEDVLLQVIGVLEHARHQANVSSWIRFGGLGNFGNMNADKDKGRFEDAKPWFALKEHLSKRQCLKPPEAKELKSRWRSYFTAPRDRQPEEDRLRSPPAFGRDLNKRTPAFWAEEGKKALLRLGIEPKMFL